MVQIKPEVELDFDENDFLQVEGVSKFNLEYEMIAQNDERQEYFLEKQARENSQETELANTWGQNVMYKISKYMK